MNFYFFLLKSDFWIRKENLKGVDFPFLSPSSLSSFSILFTFFLLLLSGFTFRLFPFSSIPFSTFGIDDYKWIVANGCADDARERIGGGWNGHSIIHSIHSFLFFLSLSLSCSFFFPLLFPSLLSFYWSKPFLPLPLFFIYINTKVKNKFMSYEKRKIFLLNAFKFQCFRFVLFYFLFFAEFCFSSNLWIIKKKKIFS